MARAIERIEQDIVGIKEAIATLSEDFYNTYERYLIALGQAARQQLILATYHLCTQGYPEAFLSLSFKQRQSLQESVRETATKTQEELLLHLKSPLEVSDAKSSINPQELAMWQEHLEQSIHQALQNLSRHANRLLQQMGVLSAKFPEAILEAAIKAEGVNEVMAGPPNLLNLLIETENSQDTETSSVTQMMAIHLRLSEIEFADSVTMAGRTQIRSLSGQLNTLGREYQKRQKERIVAEAEAAWRATWFE